MGVEAAINYDDLRRRAKRRLPRIAFDFIEGGIDGEACLARNAAAFAAIRLLPRYMTDVDAVDATTRVLGQTYGQPFGIAPTGAAGLMRAGADLMLARAAKAAGIPFILSGAATTTMEALAEIAGEHAWYQLYAPRDRAIGDDLIRRAEACGFPVLVLTVDVPVQGRNVRDIRNGLAPPVRPSFAACAEALLHPPWIWDLLRGGALARTSWDRYGPPGAKPQEMVRFLLTQLPNAVTWEDVARVRALWPRKLVLKGLLHPEDARRAAAAGVDGIIVSNHGGRQFDRAPHPLEVLGPICDAAGDRVTVMLDSGVRCGADIAAALCLGAKFAFVGRWTLYGVAAGGQRGADHAVDMIRREVGIVMRQMGVTRTELFGRELVLGDVRSAPTSTVVAADRLWHGGLTAEAG